MTTTIDNVLTVDLASMLDESRAGFPEPTLLPHLACAVPLDDLPDVLRILSAVNREWGSAAWPRLRAATAAIAAERLRNAPDNVVAQSLACCVDLFSHIDAELLAAALSVLQAPDPGNPNPPDSAQTQRLCRLAARHPDHDRLVARAARSLAQAPPGQALVAGAWFLPLCNEAQRRAIINGWLASDWPDPAAAAALFGAANDSERDRLSDSVLQHLYKTSNPPQNAAALLATLLPMLPLMLTDDIQAKVCARLTDTLGGDEWWTALLASRFAALDAPVDLPLHEVASPWRDHLRALGPLHGEFEYADVLRAHVGAGSSSSPGDANIAPEDALRVLKQFMAGRYGDSDEATAGAEEAAPPIVTPAPTVPPPPTAGSRSGGLLGAIGAAIGAGMASATRTIGDIFSGGATSGGPAESTTRSPPPDAAPAQPLPDRRLQADVRLDGAPDDAAPLTFAFVAGRVHVVEISVGRGASLRLDTRFNEPERESSTGFEVLDIRLLHGDTVVGSTLNLPHDTTLDSNVWPAQLTVPADATRVEATVVVLHKGRVLQAARLDGPVVALGERAGAQDDINFKVIADVHQFAELTQRPAFDASFVSDGRQAAAFAGETFGVQDLRGVEERINKMTQRLFKATEAVAIAGDGAEPPEAFQLLLVYLAAQGKLLHSALITPQLKALDNARTIQIVTTGKAPILPLEFLFFGPSPNHTATLCPGWRDALTNGVCNTCSIEPSADRVETICPLHFWALSKVIERHAPGEPAADGYDYHLHTGKQGERYRLAPILHALFAASNNVPENMVDATMAGLRAAWPDSDEATDWVQWREKIQSKSPALLVSMPHNALDPALDIPTLEIGRGSDLRAGEIKRTYVLRDDVQTGPLVLLLGCQTAQGGPLAYHSFVTEFRNNGASIVIGTLATVLGEHAAPIVQVVIEELAKPAAGEQTFGELLLRVRRQMFARGILIALAVAAFGDADWSLGGPGDDHAET